MGKKDVLTIKEKKLLDILVDKKSIADARNDLQNQGIKISTAYKMIERIALKGSLWMKGVNQVLGYRRKSKSHHSLLDKRLQFQDVEVENAQEKNN